MSNCPRAVFSAVFVCLALLSPARAANDKSLESAVDAFLAPLLSDDLISGSVLIAKHGKVQLAKGYGLANREWDCANTPDTKFRLGSMTKQFTAAAILLLEERGLLSVNDSLGKFYPDYPHGDKITLHHLLTHTSGIVNFRQSDEKLEMYVFSHPIDTVIACFKDKPLQFEPGEKWAYSNAGYILLAGVIERVSKIPYGDFLRQNIFDPLGMKNSGQDVFATVSKHRAAGYVNYGPEVQQVEYRDLLTMSGAGSLYSTPMDFFLWDQALYTNQLLSQASRDKMFTPYKENYGYGWFVEDRSGHNVVSHRGEISGFIGSIDRYVDDSILVVAMFNYESTFARAAIRGLWDVALGREPKPLLVSVPPAIDPAILDSYAGAYAFGGSDTLNVNTENGILYVTGLAAKEKLPAQPQTQNLFFVPGLNALIRFEADAAGKVTGLTLVNSVQVYKAARIS